MTEEERYIVIKDKIVGYDYMRGEFYISNRGTTTYSKNAQDILKTARVLGIAEQELPDDLMTSFKETYETLHKIEYTWQDNGAYINTLQFNDFDKYPLVLDCEKRNLYIKGSNTTINLATNTNTDINVNTLCTYYKDTLGLEISYNNMHTIYNNLMKYYHPHCYNQIKTDTSTNKAYYNGTFILANYDGTSNANYYATRDPHGTFKYTHIGDVISTSIEDSTITLLDTTTTLKVGDKVHVQGATLTIADQEYKADGTYTISGIKENVIKVQEPLPLTYTFPYIECYVESVKLPVISTSRADNSITLQGVTNNIITGDKITLRNTAVTTEDGLDTVVLDGVYTVQGVITTSTTTNLQVIETISTDYTAPETDNTAVAVKGVKVGNIKQTQGTTLTLVNPEGARGVKVLGKLQEIQGISNSLTGYTNKEQALSELQEIQSSVDTLINMEKEETVLSKLHGGMLIYFSNNPLTSYTIQEVNTGDNTITTTTTMPEYIAQYPQLQNPEPSDEILITVTWVTEKNINKFPTGEFMVDNFEQAQGYLGLAPNLVVPDSTIQDNMYKEVPNTMNIRNWDILLKPATETEPAKYLQEMQLKGLYSEIYESTNM